MRLAPLFSFLCTIIVGLAAYLLFLMQPLAAKLLLPLFGGASSVWITCAMFFQVALFIGYLLADILVRQVSPRTQLGLYLLLLGLSALFFPLDGLQNRTLLTSESPSAAILYRLSLVIGVPFITLSMTASLSQHWFFISGRAEPYRLYAVSNLASFFALFSFPVILEPLFDLTMHIKIWSLVLGVLVVITTILGLVWGICAPTPSSRFREADSASRPPTADRLFWLFTAALGVVILLAVTNYLSADIAPVPLLWLIPLALYLGTYVVSFSAPPGSRTTRSLIGCLAGLALFFIAASRGEMILSSSALLLTLFFGCSVCHGELARSRPAGESLSTYYKAIALGGALGGIFVGIVAPLLFDRYYEIAIAFAAPVIVRLWVLERSRLPAHAARVPLTIVATLVLFLVISDPLLSMLNGGTTRLSRNFYGTLRLTDYTEAIPPYRELSHGSTVHGVQALSGINADKPTMYYGRTSGIGLALAALPERSRTIGSIGLGAGTLAAYARTGDVFHFIEINPEIVRIAREEFTFLAHSQGQMVVHQGDGRLVLEALDTVPLDLLLIDAFSGDAIPTHLLSKEAIELYLRQSSPEGLLVFHISNRYLDLAPVLASAADSLNLHAALFYDSGSGDPLLAPSVYVVLARSDSFFRRPEVSRRLQTISDRTRMWTDRYSSVWNAFRLGPRSYPHLHTQADDSRPTSGFTRW